MLRSFLLALALCAGVPAFASPPAFSVEVHGHGPPIIFIPGLACGGSVFATAVDRYQAHHEVHVLTLAGFDGQAPIDAPLLSTARQQLAAYIRSHRLVRPMVVGHSLGGFLALWLAASEPDLVGKIVVVDAFPFLPAVLKPGATVETVKPMAERMRTMIARSTPAAFEAQNRAALATMVTEAKDLEPLATMGRRSDPQTVASAMYELMTTDLRPELERVRTPTLVLAADEPDAHAVYQAQYARLTGVQIEVVSHARHFVFLDQPAAFFAALDRVMKSPGGR